MSVRGTLWFVAKIIILTALLAITFTFAATYIMIFIFQSRINAVGENMQMELTKNNTLYTESYVSSSGGGTDSLAGFAAQLQQIADRSNGTYTFKGFAVIDVDASGVETENMLLTIDYDSVTGEPTGNFAYATDRVGAYGEFRTLRLYFDAHGDIMLPQSGSASVFNMVHEVFTRPQHFDYVAPCLRYLKGGEV